MRVCFNESSSKRFSGSLIAGALLTLFSFSDQAVCVPPADAPRYAIYLLGFVDQEHTSASGLQRSQVGAADPDNGISADALVGFSDRFSAFGQTGESGWYFDTTTRNTTRLGIFDPSQLSNPFYKSTTFPLHVNAAGQVTGTSSNSLTSDSAPALAWFYDPTTGNTKRIGYSTLTSPPDKLSDGSSFLQPDGVVIGVTAVGNKGAQFAWVYDPGLALTTPIGLSASPDLGSSSSSVLQRIAGVSRDDVVAGTTFFGSSSSGQAVWVYDPVGKITKRVGLFDDTYWRLNGTKFSEISGMSISGLVAGRSIFRADTTERYQAWIYDPMTDSTRSIGLSDPTTANQWTDDIVSVTDADRVYGTSASDITTVPWIFNNDSGLTATMGLTAGDNLLSNGGSKNVSVAFSSTGFVLGKAQRNSGDTRSDFNQTPWVFDPTTGLTHAAGLTAGGYTSTGGGRWATPLQINDLGQAIGTSRLFNGNGSSLVRERYNRMLCSMR